MVGMIRKLYRLSKFSNINKLQVRSEGRMFDNSIKEVRGSEKECDYITEVIESLTAKFPLESKDKPFWYVHLPKNQSFIDNEQTPNYVRKQVVQALVDAAKHLLDIKPRSLKFCKVLVVPEFDNVFDSQLIVFFNEDYYNNFFDRANDYQRWSLLDEECYKIKRWDIEIPECFTIRGYLEEINENGNKYVGKLWFIGQL